MTTEAPFDYGFHITAAILLWLLYLAVCWISRRRREVRELRAERDWAATQLAHLQISMDYRQIHGSPRDAA